MSEHEKHNYDDENFLESLRDSELRFLTVIKSADKIKKILEAR